MTFEKLLSLTKLAAKSPWLQLNTTIDSTSIKTPEGTYRIITGEESPFHTGQYLCAATPERTADMIVRLQKLSQALEKTGQGKAILKKYGIKQELK